MSYQSTRPGSVVWLTPPEIIHALGGALSFDLDPCSLAIRPWDTAKRHLYLPDYDGLQEEWEGRVWMNPPYTDGEIVKWLSRLASHNNGTALIFARTDTQAFLRHVWNKADSLLFIKGRLSFYSERGVLLSSAPAPSVLCAYGANNTDILAASGIKGAFIPLRLPKSIMCLAWSQLPSWSDVVFDWVMSQGKTVSISDAYIAFAGHAKTISNPNWKAKIRQMLQSQRYRRIERGMYEVA